MTEEQKQTSPPPEHDGCTTLNVKKIYWLIAGAAAAVAICVLTAVYFSDANSVGRAIQRGDTAAVNRFVRANLDRQSQRSLIVRCLKDSLSKKLTGVIENFEEIALKPNTSDVWRSEIFRQFKAAGRSFSGTQALLDLILANEAKDFAEDAADELKLAPLSERRAAIYSRLRTVLSDSPTSKWNHIQKQRSLSFAFNLLPEMADQINKFQKIEEASFEVSMEPEKVQSSIDKVEYKLEDVVRTISEPRMMLQGYIVAQHAPVVYEIMLANGGQHALLLSSESNEFQNKGYFSLEVSDMGTEATQLKEEYGGFTQMWHRYIECNYVCTQVYHEREVEANQLREELIKLRADYAKALQDSTDTDQLFLREQHLFLETN